MIGESTGAEFDHAPARGARSEETQTPTLPDKCLTISQATLVDLENQNTYVIQTDFALGVSLLELFPRGATTSSSAEIETPTYWHGAAQTIAPVRIESGKRFVEHRPAAPIDPERRARESEENRIHAQQLRNRIGDPIAAAHALLLEVFDQDVLSASLEDYFENDDDFNDLELEEHGG